MAPASSLVPPAIFDEVEQAPRAAPARDEPTAATTLRALWRDASAKRRADSRLDAAVLDAHAHGNDWATIGTALGISRQAARQRYHDRATATAPPTATRSQTPSP